MKKFDHEKHNPCWKENQLVFKCYNENNFDRALCVREIENYKVCKGFWTFVRADRRRKGITPQLPPMEEREQIKRDYFAKYKQ